ncbi:MAG: DEAD/DEAH box helicase [Bacteroidetes bacterium]|nr:DEAD/DEAH box helicase [Bacteroidota bacterium]
MKEVKKKKETKPAKTTKITKSVEVDEIVVEMSEVVSRAVKPKVPTIGKLDLKAALQEYFGFDSFKDEQEKIIRNLLEGQDIFVIMPTGGGKSMCYQLPALISQGTAIIISPKLIRFARLVMRMLPIF